MNTTRAMLIIGVLMLILAVIVAQSLRPSDTQSVTGPVHSGSVVNEVAEATPPVTVTPGQSGNALMPLNTGVLKMDSTTPATGLSPVSPAELPPVVETLPPPVQDQAQEQVQSAAEGPSGQTVTATAQEIVSPGVPAQTSSSAGQEAAPAETAQPTQPAHAEKLVTTASAPASLAPGQKAVNRTRLEITRNSLTFRISAASAISGKAFTLKQPDRVVVDLDGPWAIEMPRTPSNSFIRAARAGNQEAETRIVFDMRRMPRSYKLVQIDARTLELQMQGT